MNNRQLTWRHLKALDELYRLGYSGARIIDNPYIKSVLFDQKKILRHKSGNLKVLEATDSFKQFYEQNFKRDFAIYERFLISEGLEHDARRRYSEDDIQTLIFISEQRDELAKQLTTIRTFSSTVFKSQGSKYLENKPGLKAAVCRLLGVKDFPQGDPKILQWRCVVDCLSPKAVVLCENMASLKGSWKARERRIELWYVGGNNIGIIDHIGEEKLNKPLYYACDWDYDGLAIYSRVTAKLKQKNFAIKLLMPSELDRAMSTRSPHHASFWKVNVPLSGLNAEIFSIEEKALIEKLIFADQWIEEESQDYLAFFDLPPSRASE